jgi:peptidoglycan/LPS O-acetylase OafA/YrhL
MTAGGERVPEVQSLRAVAILLVAAYHYFSAWTMPIDGNNIYPGTLASLMPHTWLGVELFFMVSGFVISMTLLRSGSAGEFALKRVIRLWPALVLALPIVFVVGNVYGPDMYGHPLSHLFTSSTLIDPLVLNSALPLSTDWVTAVLWTMWIEIQFYALAAMLYFALRSRFLVGLGAMTVLGAVLTWLSAPMPAIFAYLPWFLAGALFHQQWRAKRAEPWQVVLLMAIFANEALRLWYHAEGTAIVLPALFFLAFVAIVRQWRIAVVLRSAALVLLGELSYEFYLVHDTIGVTIINALVSQFGFESGPHLFGAALGFGVSLALAWLIHRLTTPWRRALLRRWVRQREMTAVS